LAVKKYQRKASAPKRSMTSQGTTMLPLDFDIFWPVGVEDQPEADDGLVGRAVEEQHADGQQRVEPPRVWSSASQTKFA
jgi:hypothetical protein